MNVASYNKILEHPDKDEIISKLVVGISPRDINEWLRAKYNSLNESKFIINEKSLKSFKDNYLDMYNTIMKDIQISKVNKTLDVEDQIELSVKNNAKYNDKMNQIAEGELDVRKMVSKLCVNIENRLAQVFDEIQEDPRNVNVALDNVLLKYADTLGSILDKYYKFTEGPAIASIGVQNNVTLQVVDQHIVVFHDVIKNVLSQMDLESSLYFMEVFNKEMGKLKSPKPGDAPSTENRLIEAKILNDSINKKIEEM